MSLRVTLRNDHPSSNIICYITGEAINSGNQFCWVRDNGDLYFPSLPAAGSPPLGLEQNVEINLGGPGGSRDVTIPFLQGGRVWYVLDTNLEFRRENVNGVVRPTFPNFLAPDDINFNRNFGFTEFTFNQANLFANLTYVDFVGIPNSISTEGRRGSQNVPGMPVDGFNQVRALLEEQAGKDNQPWGSLVSSNGLRILAPARAIGVNGGGFEGYYDGYVNETYAKYANQDLIVDTQDGRFGTRNGRVTNNVLDFGDGVSFSKPSTLDIFDNTTGPFANGSELQQIIRTRLAAGFTRTTILERDQQPNGANVPDYYQRDPTNYYAKFVHQVSLQSKGYAFPFDDVVPNDNPLDQGGILQDEAPTSFTVTIGGTSASARAARK